MPARCPQPRKAAYATRGAALRKLAEIHRTNVQAAVAPRAEPCRAYRCDCGAWHLTSKPLTTNPRTTAQEGATA